MPLLPASLTEPLWVEFAALIGTDERPEFAPDHPWGCHRRRIPDRVVFDHLIGAFVHPRSAVDGHMAGLWVTSWLFSGLPSR